MRAAYTKDEIKALSSFYKFYLPQSLNAGVDKSCKRNLHAGIMVDK